MDLQIRAAELQDIPAIRQVAMLTWPHAYAEIMSYRQMGYMLHHMYNETVLQQQLSANHAGFIALQQGQVIGFAITGPQDEPGLFKLHKLYVLPYLHARGTGSQLLHQVENYAQGQGGSRLQLAVNRNNKAVDFYRRMGFSIASQGDFSIGAGFFMHDYIMEKALR